MKFDLHIHTRWSGDSALEFEAIKCQASSRGLSGVAITDHETFEGAAGIVSGERFLVIKGMEICTEFGDIVALFISRAIASRDFMGVRREISEQNGICVLPHPYRTHKETERLAREVDVIEVFNAQCSDEENAKARVLAERLGKPMIAGSDAHTIGYVGCCYTEVDEPVRENILRGKTTVVEGYPPLRSRLARKVDKVYHAPREKKIQYLKHPIKEMKKLF